MKEKVAEIQEFAGLITAVDPFDVGAAGATALTNLTCSRTAMLQTRPGYIPVTFEDES